MFDLNRVQNNFLFGYGGSIFFLLLFSNYKFFSMKLNGYFSFVCTRIGFESQKQ